MIKFLENNPMLYGVVFMLGLVFGLAMIFPPFFYIMSLWSRWWML